MVGRYVGNVFAPFLHGYARNGPYGSNTIRAESGQKIMGKDQGRGNDFFLGGGKHVDMPSDCQNLGGGAQAYSSPSDKKLGGEQLPPLPPGSRAPGKDL